MTQYSIIAKIEGNLHIKVGKTVTMEGHNDKYARSELTPMLLFSLGG